MTLTGAIVALNDVIADLPGLVRFYTDPPEAINEFPCAMVYINDGVYVDAPSGGYALHTVRVDIYKNRIVMQQAINDAKGWPDKMRTALRADVALGGAVAHIGDANMLFRYQAGPMPYGETMRYGVRFWIPVKVNYV